MVDISKFENIKTKKSPYQVVFIGRLVKRKGCQQLIKAFVKVHETIPEARLVIGGDGPQRVSLERLVSKLGLNAVVDFKGYIKEEQKPGLLAGAAVACFPSLYGESFGIVLIEAMAAGSGVVLAGNNPGYASVMGSISSVMFDPENSNDLSAKIIHFLKDKADAEQVHKKQSELVKEFDVATVGAKIEKLYEQAIANNSQTRHN